MRLLPSTSLPAFSGNNSPRGQEILILILAAAASSAFAQGKLPAPKDQLYIEVSALGNLDYFYDHKLGMSMVGKARSPSPRTG